MAGKQINIVLAFIILLTGWVAAENVEYTAQRYQVILERSPFGANPLTEAERSAQQNAKNAAAEAAAAKAAEKELRLCFLLESDTGEVRAGFENKTAKPGDPRSVMLMEGESFRGMKLLEIDLINSTATLDRNGVRVNFALAKGTAPKVAPAKQPQRKFGGGFRRQPQPAPKPAEPELTPEEQVAQREAIRENLRQYQMEVIRQGMPPLPIPLTQDMDDQLVAEGILPPE